MLRYVYTLFIGILLATFVGVGINAFFPEPRFPIYRVSPHIQKPTSASQEAQVQQQEIKMQEEQITYQKHIDEYNKNVAIISLIASILFVILSLTLVKEIMFIADGILFGGVLTLLYSIGRGFVSQDSTFQFIIVAIGLIISLTLGYRKFRHATRKHTKKK